MARVGDHSNLVQVNRRRADAIGAPRKRAWKPGGKPTLANGKRVDLGKVRSEKLVTGKGLSALARDKLGHKQVLQQLLEAHRQFKKDAAESLVSSLTEMSHRQLAQVYRNLKDNSSILSAISQTHGDTSDLFVFAEGILNLVTNTVRQRDMSADDIKPKPFDVHVPENNAITKTLAALA